MIGARSPRAAQRKLNSRRGFGASLAPTPRFSAPQQSLSFRQRSAFNTFPPNPFQDVRRAISEFYVLVLALAQETNGRKIDEDNLRQVENCD
jgi:hypothetical protein